MTAKTDGTLLTRAESPVRSALGSDVPGSRRLLGRWCVEVVIRYCLLWITTAPVRDGRYPNDRLEQRRESSHLCGLTNILKDT